MESGWHDARDLLPLLSPSSSRTVLPLREGLHQLLQGGRLLGLELDDGVVLVVVVGR